MNHMVVVIVAVLALALAPLSVVNAQGNCAGCERTLNGEHSQTHCFVGIFVPGQTKKGTCTAEVPCAGAEPCRFNFTAGVVKICNDPNAVVIIYTTYTQVLPNGETVHTAWPPVVTDGFQNPVVNYPVTCGGRYEMRVLDPDPVTGGFPVIVEMLCAECTPAAGG